MVKTKNEMRICDICGLTKAKGNVWLCGTDPIFICNNCEAKIKNKSNGNYRFEWEGWDRTQLMNFLKYLNNCYNFRFRKMVSSYKRYKSLMQENISRE